MVDTFEKFMEKEYYNEIFDALKSYILKNRKRLEVGNRADTNPQYIELVTLRYEYFVFKYHRVMK